MFNNPILLAIVLFYIFILYLVVILIILKIRKSKKESKPIVRRTTKPVDNTYLLNYHYKQE